MYEGKSSGHAMTRKWSNRKEIPTPKIEVGKTKLTIMQVLILKKHIVGPQ